MKRLLAVGCALGFTGAGLVAFATPGSAGDPPEEPTVPEVEYILLEAGVTPAAPTVGQEYTIAPVENCKVADTEEPGELIYFLAGDNGTPDDFDDDTELEDLIPLEADGSWAGITRTSDVAENIYFIAGCIPTNWEELDESCFDDGPQEPVLEAEALAAATDDEHPATTEPPTTTLPAEPPVDCTFEFYEFEFSVGNPPPPAPRPPTPIPGVGPLTG